MTSKTTIHILILIFLFLCAVLFYYLFFTTSGSSRLAKFLILRYSGAKEISIGASSGSLSRELLLKDIEISHLKDLPEGNNLKIQTIKIYFGSLGLQGLNAKVFNGRLTIPEAASVFLSGSYRKGMLEFNIFSNQVNLRDVVSLLRAKGRYADLSGFLTGLDFYLKGRISGPELTGKFIISNIKKESFSLINSPVSLSLIFKDYSHNPKIFGDVILGGGTISGPRIATIKIEQSKIIFSGNPGAPQLDLKGNSSVGSVKIAITLKGPAEKPDLKLSSEPPMPQGKLLVMLATGKSWQGAEGIFGKGQISPDLAADFIDYVLFAGEGSKIAERFGIGVSLKYEGQTKGIGIKKSINEKTEASYTIEQTNSKEGVPAQKQKIGSEYKIRGGVSVGAEKELKQPAAKDQSQEKAPAENKVFLKFKKEF